MLRQLRLQNFKNFRDATLQLGGLTLLVGTNASGKSNLRDAFRFIHGMSRGYSLAETIGEKWVEGGTLQWKGIRGGLREVCRFGESTFAIETIVREMARIGLWLHHRIQVEVGTDGPRVKEECLYRTIRAPHSLRLNDRLLLYDSHPQNNPPKQESPQFLHVRLPRGGNNRKLGKRLQLIAAQAALPQILSHEEAPSRVHKMAAHFGATLHSMQFLDLSPDAMRMPSYPGQDVLGDRGENLSSVLEAICRDANQKQAVIDWIQELTPLDVCDFRFVPDQTGRILLSLVEPNGCETSAFSASDGTLRFLAIIAALFGPRPAKFYFFEELDNGIHPTRLHLLLQLIEQQIAARGLQIVATTHSPQMLAFLSETSLQHATLVYRLREENEAHLLRILDIPDVERVLQDRNLSRLHETGWLEHAVAFGVNGSRSQ